jgi:hypothetical protein
MEQSVLPKISCTIGKLLVPEGFVGRNDVPNVCVDVHGWFGNSQSQGASGFVGRNDLPNVCVDVQGWFGNSQSQGTVGFRWTQ